MDTEQEWISTRKAAKILGYHYRTLLRWRRQDSPPPDVVQRFGDDWRWYLPKLVEWAASRRAS